MYVNFMKCVLVFFVFLNNVAAALVLYDVEYSDIIVCTYVDV